LQKPPTRRLAEEVLKCGDAQCVLSYEGAAASAYWATLSSAFGVPGRSPEASDPL
jgi:CRISPR/Cas system-associated endonuclease Cas1